MLCMDLPPHGLMLTIGTLALAGTANFTSGAGRGTLVPVFTPLLTFGSNTVPACLSCLGNGS